MPSCTPPPGDPELRPLTELFRLTHALRDHLETVFDHSERLGQQVSQLTEATLRGQPPALAPVLALQSTQSALQERAQHLLHQAAQQAQVLSLLHSSGPGPGPSPITAAQLPALLGLLDALALLQPLFGSSDPASRGAAYALQAQVERVLRCALKGEDLAIALGFVEAERMRLAALPGAEQGVEALARAVEGLGG